MLDLPPYARFLGVTATLGEDQAPLFRMTYSPEQLGRPNFLHGGAIAGLLELAAIGTVLHALGENAGVGMKPITVTVDYTRGGLPQDTLARATIARLGNRIANVEAVAWQEDASRPIASARLNLALRRNG